LPYKKAMSPTTKIQVVAVICTLFTAVWSCQKLVPGAPEAHEVIAEPIAGLSSSQLAQFIHGDELFAKVYSPAEGLGPIFVQTGCEGCHVGDGKGHPFNSLTRFGKWENGTFDYMLDQGGPQLQHRSISAYAPEVLPEGHTNTSERIAPIVIGMGLLAALHDTTILNLADPFDMDGDGISGRINYLAPEEFFIPRAYHIDSAGYYIGRFGKKASKISLLEQIVFALTQDMGLTSDYNTEDPVNHAISSGANDGVPDPEVGSDVVSSLLFYMRTLKAPTRRNEDDADVIAGFETFQSIGCGKCHIPTLTTGVSEIEALSQVEFHAYTDLLLHDMGNDLDDGYPEGSASGSEWRTPPLWGLGLAADSQGGTAYYLHDGRASTISGTISFHGGEAFSAAEAFFNLSAAEKAQLEKFLNSL
jgi:CxxC motif-containing protein (DUF1111 family)